MNPSKIIIVEDEDVVADKLKSRIEDFGHSVSHILSSGEKAIDAIKESEPDLVIMDIMLKGEMDRIETSQIINRDYDIPVIYITAYSDKKL